MKVQRSVTDINHGIQYDHTFSIDGIPDSQTITVQIYAESSTGIGQSSANVLQGRLHPNAPWHTINSLGAGSTVLQTTTNPYPFIRVRVTSDSGIGTKMKSTVSIF